MQRRRHDSRCMTAFARHWYKNTARTLAAPLAQDHRGLHCLQEVGQTSALCKCFSLEVNRECATTYVGLTPMNGFQPIQALWCSYEAKRDMTALSIVTTLRPSPHCHA